MSSRDLRGSGPAAGSNRDCALTIQDLGSIGELVVAVATVATLAYLAFQIRQNTQSIGRTGCVLGAASDKG